MYEAFFNLQTPPFSATPLVANYFPAPAIEAARQSLIRVIERAEGPALVIGPAGVGKSLLLNTLAEHFGERFGVVLLSGTRIATRRSLLQSVLFELELPYRGMDEGELRLGLIDALRPGGSFPEGILLLVDEAHTLPLRLLDEIRMITNVVRDGLPRARLVLAGGQLLEERFASPKLESFSQRIAARCYLQPLSRDETHEYVRAQISWAGGDPDSMLDVDVPRAVHQASDGIPRLINQICDHALVLAHSAGIRRINAALIQEAWADLQQLPPPWQVVEPAAPASGSTVIEFGELADTDSLDEVDPGLELPPARETDLIADYASDVSARSSETSEDVVRQIEALTSVVMGFAASDVPVQWFDGEVAELTTEERQLAPNPFDGQFEEEVVVIDRDTASGVETLRGRTRVCCHASKDILAQLRTSLNDDLEDGMSDTEAALTEAVQSDRSGEFELSTGETGSGDPEPLSDLEQHAGVVDSFTDEQHDFDEDIGCVPLPWTSAGPGDDRDLIVIEEDMTSGSCSSAGSSAASGSRRIEYRDLFAQLRQATP